MVDSKLPEVLLFLYPLTSGSLACIHIIHYHTNHCSEEEEYQPSPWKLGLGHLLQEILKYTERNVKLMLVFLYRAQLKNVNIQYWGESYRYLYKFTT